MYAAIEKVLCSSTAAAAIEKGRSKRGFSTAAAAGGRTSQNFAAIGALLYYAGEKRCQTNCIALCSEIFVQDIFYKTRRRRSMFESFDLCFKMDHNIKQSSSEPQKRAHM